MVAPPFLPPCGPAHGLLGATSVEALRLPLSPSPPGSLCWPPLLRWSLATLLAFPGLVAPYPLRPVFTLGGWSHSSTSSWLMSSEPVCACRSLGSLLRLYCAFLLILPPFLAANFVTYRIFPTALLGQTTSRFLGPVFEEARLLLSIWTPNTTLAPLNSTRPPCQTAVYQWERCMHFHAPLDFHGTLTSYSETWSFALDGQEFPYDGQQAGTRSSGRSELAPGAGWTWFQESWRGVKEVYWIRLRKKRHSPPYKKRCLSDKKGDASVVFDKPPILNWPAWVGRRANLAGFDTLSRQNRVVNTYKKNDYRSFLVENLSPPAAFVAVDQVKRKRWRMNNHYAHCAYRHWK